jgi:hypothetical protein
MMICTSKTASDDEHVSCANCQHSVDVRGIKQIVCLAYLAVFDAAKAEACGEFEVRRSPRIEP